MVAKQPENRHQFRYEELQAVLQRRNTQLRNCIEYLCDYLVDSPETDFKAEIQHLLSSNDEFSNRFRENELFKLLRFTPAPTLADLMPVNWNALTPDISVGRMLWQADTLEKKIRCISSLDISNRLNVMKDKDRSGRTLLHNEVNNPESLEIILNLLPESERLNVVKEKDRYGLTVLHLAAENPESLKTILNLLPESERLEMVKEKDSDGYTVLHKAAKNPESLEIILNSLPESDRLNVVKEKDNHGQTVLHLAANNPKSLEIILRLLPESDRLEVLKEKNRYGQTVLHRAANNSTMLMVICESLPMADLSKLLREVDSSSLSPEYLMVYKKSLVNKATALGYSEQSVMALNNAETGLQLQEALNDGTQSMIKTQMQQRRLDDSDELQPTVKPV